ncbi:hypothetical protein JCM6882_002224 [Rhodosporidiobolus microsporus]
MSTTPRAYSSYGNNLWQARDPVQLSRKFVIEWKVEDVNAMLAATKAGEARRLHSSYTDDQRWYLELRMRGAKDKDYAGVFISARGDKVDQREASTTKLWSRSGIWDATFEFETVKGVVLCPPARFQDRSFDSKSSAWGFSDCIPWTALEGQGVTEPNAFVIRCTMAVKNERKDAHPSTDEPAPLVALFREPQYSNVAFRIQPDGVEKPSYLFATEMIVGQCDYFAPDIHGYGYEYRSRRSPSPDPSSRPKQSKIRFNPKELPTERPQEAFEGDLDEFAIWETFRAFLKFLHGGNPHFCHSPSDYLVACQSPSAASSLPPLNVWIERDLPDFWLHLCQPHALYRLAHRYKENGMKKLAKGYILRSLTTENVAYEAFCQLSLDFPEDFQKPVIAFMLEHWNDVKSSKAFSQVLELFEAGDLPSGASVFTRLFDGLAARKVDEGKEKNN